MRLGWWLVATLVCGTASCTAAPTSMALASEKPDGSAALSPVSAAQADHVSLLVQVWSFLKFHHRAATTGRVDWDGELIDMLARVAGASSDADALQAITDWVEGLGTSACDTCATSPPSRAQASPLPAPIEWIHDEARLGPNLSASLVKVYAARAWTGSQHFVSLAPNVGNPVSTNEAQHATPPLPPAALRVLAVARIWSTINYWFPYRNLVDAPWESTLPSAISDAIAADSEQAYRRVLLRLLAKVNDGHAVLLANDDHRPPTGACRAQAVVRFVEDVPIVVSASAASGLEPGDRIVALDGESIASRIKEWLPYYAASTKASRANLLAINLLRGACGNAADITVVRDGKNIPLHVRRVDTQVTRDTLARDLPGPAFRKLAGNIGYMKVSNIRAADVADHLDAAANSAGLIVDLRAYPAEFVVFELAGRLVAHPTPFAKFTVADLASPGAFTFTDAIALQPIAPRFSGKVVVLIDESTASQPEYTAMALRAAGATLIGTPSAGADGNVSTVELPGGSRFMFSGIGVFYPDGTVTQGVGLTPDILAAPTIEGVTSCRDEVLEAAVAHLTGAAIPIEDAMSFCRTLDDASS